MVNTGVNWTIGDGLKKIAWRMPEKTALIFEDKFITYRELNEGANRVAHFLKEKGIKKGDRIAVYLRNCPEFLEVYFAAAKLGVILVTLNFRLTGSETEYELNNSGSRLLVFHDVYATFIDFHSLNSTVEDDKYICVRSVVPEFEVCVPDWAVEFHQAVDRYPACEPELDEPVDLNDPLAIIYTSGVTGGPQGYNSFSSTDFFQKHSNRRVYVYSRRHDHGMPNTFFSFRGVVYYSDSASFGGWDLGYERET